MPKSPSFIRRTLEAPWFTTLVIVAIFAFIALNMDGIYKYFTEGALAMLGSGILIAAFYVALARVVRFLTISIPKEQANAIFKDHPAAYVGLCAANLIGSAIVTHAVFT